MSGDKWRKRQAQFYPSFFWFLFVVYEVWKGSYYFTCFRPPLPNGSEGCWIVVFKHAIHVMALYHTLCFLQAPHLCIVLLSMWWWNFINLVYFVWKLMLCLLPVKFNNLELEEEEWCELWYGKLVFGAIVRYRGAGVHLFPFFFKKKM